MQKFLKLSLLAAAVALTSAARPFVPAQALMAFVPLAIIEGGTVSTLPKGAKSHTGKVVVLRGRGDRANVAPANKRALVATPATASTTMESGNAASGKPCQCSPGGVSAGGSSGDIVELRSTEIGLRVMIIGPDGLTRTRYVPAPPGSTARFGQD